MNDEAPTITTNVNYPHWGYENKCNGNCNTNSSPKFAKKLTHYSADAADHGHQGYSKVI